MKNTKTCKKPNPISYGIAKIVSAYYNAVLNNHTEYKDCKHISGPAVILGNHTSSYDQFISAQAVSKRMFFLLSDAMFYSLPCHSFFESLQLLHKQQCFTGIDDIRQMKNIIEHKGILMLYPTGTCSLCGENTKLPSSTGKLLKLLGADVYIIKEHGMYLSNPKWQKGIRRGRVETQVYRILNKEELKKLTPEGIYATVAAGLGFNDYEWQEDHRIIYQNGDQIKGLENVLYDCPKCGAHFSIMNRDNHLTCTKCGFEEYADKYGFLHSNTDGFEIRYPTKWHELQKKAIRDNIERDNTYKLHIKARILKLDKAKKKFAELGYGTVYADKSEVKILLDEKEVIYSEAVKHLIMLPMIPGEYFDLQNGKDIFRCFTLDSKDTAYIADFISAANEIG